MGDAHVNERDQEYNLDIAENISHRPGSKHRLSTPCRLGCSKWCSKYFWEGKSTLWSLPGRGGLCPGGGYLSWRPPPQLRWKNGCTHPTGMHSSCFFCFILSTTKLQIQTILAACLLECRVTLHSLLLLF